MKRLQAYKFEIRPNGQHHRQMMRSAGARRFVFNKSLALSIRYYRRFHKSIGYARLCKAIVKWKRLYPFLSEVPSQALQQSLKDLGKAYENFFAKRADFPKFSKKGLNISYRLPQGCELDQANNRIRLPKLGWIKYRNSREVLGEIKNVTISSTCGKWYASIQTSREVIEKLHPSMTSVGIDVGIAKFATLSDGTVFEAINSFKQKQVKLARYQRALSRKVKFSINWKKQQSKIAKLHHTIANIRKDYLHKTTTTISQNHALVMIEDLQVSQMSRSAKGSIAQPGRKVRQKAGLNRSILDQGFGEFRRQIEYKQDWLGGEVIAVKPHYTSQECNQCHHISKENRRTQSVFKCVACGLEMNADLNAAINIKAAGHAVLACGESALSGRSMKQELAEVTKDHNHGI